MRLPLWMLQALIYSLFGLSVLRTATIRNEFLSQLETAGARSLILSGAMGLLFGTVIIDQTVRMFGAAGEAPLRLLGWSLFGEIGPLVVGFLVAARMAPAIGANLALMRFRGELDNLAEINISIADYLVVPRVISLIAVGALLSVYFMASTLLGGMLLASYLHDFSFLHQLQHFFEIAHSSGMIFAVIKSGLFGGSVALVSCYYGLMVERDSQHLHEAGSDALTHCILALCALELLSALLSIAIGAG